MFPEVPMALRAGLSLYTVPLLPRAGAPTGSLSLPPCSEAWHVDPPKHISLQVNKSGKLEQGGPQYTATAELTTLVVLLNEIQLLRILILLDYLSTCALREKYGWFRPWHNPLSRKLDGWQRMWWHYAQESVLSDVRRKLRKTSWSNFGRRLSYRQKYVSLYKRKLELLHQEQPEHQQLIVDAGALTYLVSMLKCRSDGSSLRATSSVIRRAADAITNLSHENSSIKTHVRMEGGIPPLVELLEFTDTKVQQAAAGALRTLAFKNDENKNQIVECNALPTLILMLRSEDASIHYEAYGVIGNLVHSSPNIKKVLLLAGALQPVIGLLRNYNYGAAGKAIGQDFLNHPELV